MITTNEMNFRVEERNFYALYGYDRWYEIWEKDAIEYLLSIAQKRFKNFPIYYFQDREVKGRIPLYHWKKKLQHFRDIDMKLINAGTVEPYRDSLRWYVCEVNEVFLRENIRNIARGDGFLFTVLEEIDYDCLKEVSAMYLEPWDVRVIEKLIEKRIYPISIYGIFDPLYITIYWESQRWPREDEKPVSLPQVKEVII